MNQLSSPDESVSLSDPPKQARRDDICKHIFTASATLVGVCLTVIGILNVMRGLGAVRGYSDALLSLDALGFLSSCVIAYIALRTESRSRRRAIERYADAIFLLSLAVMTVACVLIAFELT